MPASGTACRGIAVAIGLFSVDPAHYRHPPIDLPGCEPDANDMAAIAQEKGLEVHKLLTQQATRSAVVGAIHDAASQLGPGDLFVLSYSGHGGQTRDINGDEPDGQDETWCLYDGQLLDDELYKALAEFKPGVRALVFSDSCHSGTVVKMERRDFENPTPARTIELNRLFNKAAIPNKSIRALPSLPPAGARRPLAAGASPAARAAEDRAAADRTAEARRATARAAAAPPVQVVYRALPPLAAIETYRDNKAFYDQIGAAAPREDQLPMQCSVILISGCEDYQVSADLGTNGLFTYILKQEWANGMFGGDHPGFHREIRAGVSAEIGAQQPAYFRVYGDEQACLKFERQNPYSLVVP